MKTQPLSALSPKRILVCQLRQLGDVILATPAIELIKKKYPLAELHVLTEDTCAKLLENNPNIHTLWRINKKKLSNIFKEVLWYWKVAQTQFDIVIDFQQLPRCRWVVAFSKAPVRLSYTPPWYNKFLYTHSVNPIDGYSGMSKASILSPLGIHWNGEKPRIYLHHEELSSAQNLLHSLGLTTEHALITLDATHKKETRRWPIEHYTTLMAHILKAHPHVKILPLWGPGEYQYIQHLIQHKPLQKNILLPQKMLSLREMAACIHFAKLHIGNCSAPRHIAVAVDTPSFTILGSTSSAWTYPSPHHRNTQANLSCQPCNRNTCIHIQCLNKLLPQSVYQALNPMLHKYISIP